MNELYVFKLWNKLDNHAVRQTKRGKKLDMHIVRIATRELHYAIQFDTRILTDA